MPDGVQRGRVGVKLLGLRGRGVLESGTAERGATRHTIMTIMRHLIYGHRHPDHLLLLLTRHVELRLDRGGGGHTKLNMTLWHDVA